MNGRVYPNPYATSARGARESRSVAERAERSETTTFPGARFPNFLPPKQFWHHKVTVGRFQLSSFRALRLSALSLYS